jgi:prefoldin subunit 5
MTLEELQRSLASLNNKKEKIANEIKEINKKAKDEISKRKPLLTEIDKDIYVKELEIKVKSFES